MQYVRYHELLELCFKAKEKGHDVFFSYRAHINKIVIEIFKNGWESGVHIKTFEFKIGSDACLEAIAFINELLQEVE